LDVIYSLLPAMLLLALASVVIFFWAAKSGQYDDMEGPAHRILDDDDDPMLPKGHYRKSESKPGTVQQEAEDKSL